MPAEDYAAYIARINAALGLQEDSARADRAMSSAVSRVKNLTNLSELPEGLDHVVVRIAAGEYIDLAMLGGLVRPENVAALAKEIRAGDTTVTFAAPESSSPQQLLVALIDRLKNGYMDEIYRYRRLLW